VLGTRHDHLQRCGTFNLPSELSKVDVIVRYGVVDEFEVPAVDGFLDEPRLHVVGH